MELLESNSTHWKSKVIVGLPPLFAERIRKVLRGTRMSIDYNNYSYGKLFSFAIDIPSKKKESHKKDFKRKRVLRRNNMKRPKEERIFIKPKRILLNSSPKISDTDEGNSSTSEDQRVLHEESYTPSSEEEQESCNKGQCSNHCCNTDDELFNIYSQFRDLKINVLSNNNLIDLLRVIKDPELRSQLIDKIPTSAEVGTEVEEIPSQKGPYTMSEIRKMMKNKSQPERLATVQDLSTEINHLKKEISELKASNVALDERIFRLENSVVINTDSSVRIIEIDNIASSSEEKAANTLLAIMRPVYRLPRQRGRGKASTNNRESNTLAQIENQRLIAANVTQANSKLVLQMSNQQGNLYGEELIQQIQAKIEAYVKLDITHVAEEKLSHFEMITKRLQMKKGAISKKEILASYFEETKKDLARNFETIIRDDISMASIGSTSNEEVCVAGEAQSPSDIEINIEEIEDFYTKLKENAEESSEKNDKGKIKV
ncbi:uncharacterized protein [Nicotiana sylvestris]|uniref:uncharacterized protein n=1 Tax=Nicotiana sylvestris TaxID=4096 RepID=UPI00388C33FB